MLDFELCATVSGIPVYHQRLPETIRSTAMALTVLVGSADDTNVGEPGIYHWFEHVPFRGTAKFPNGYAATKVPISRVGGHIGAATNQYATRYVSALPTRHARKAVEILVDLVSAPLLAEEAIIAEREIIFQEIRDRNGGVDRFVDQEFGKIIWHGHPFEHPVTGTAESLNSMTPDLLHKARASGYDRSRMAFVASSSLEPRAIADMFAEFAHALPSNGLEERRSYPRIKPIEWRPGYVRYVETGFAPTIMRVLFESAPLRSVQDMAKRLVLRSLFSHGGSGSPLYRIIREDNCLAYETSIADEGTPDGGFWGFEVKTSRMNAEKARKVLPSIVSDPQLASREWFDSIQESVRNARDMIIVDPERQIRNAIGSMTFTGRPVGYDEMSDASLAITHEEALSWIEEIRFEEAVTLVALGKE